MAAVYSSAAIVGVGINIEDIVVGDLFPSAWMGLTGPLPCSQQQQSSLLLVVRWMMVTLLPDLALGHQGVV